MGFARIKIQIDTAWPLVPGVLIRDEGIPYWQQFQYENLTQVCFLCGLVGHIDESCPHRSPKGANPAAASDGSSGPRPRLGPWVVASRSWQPWESSSSGKPSARYSSSSPGSPGSSNPASAPPPSAAAPMPPPAAAEGWRKPAKVARKASFAKEQATSSGDAAGGGALGPLASVPLRMECLLAAPEPHELAMVDPDSLALKRGRSPSPEEAVDDRQLVLATKRSGPKRSARRRPKPQPLPALPAPSPPGTQVCPQLPCMLPSRPGHSDGLVDVPIGLAGDLLASGSGYGAGASGSACAGNVAPGEAVGFAPGNVASGEPVGVQLGAVGATGRGEGGAGADAGPGATDGGPLSASAEPVGVQLGAVGATGRGEGGPGADAGPGATDGGPLSTEAGAPDALSVLLSSGVSVAPVDPLLSGALSFSASRGPEVGLKEGPLLDEVSGSKPSPGKKKRGVAVEVSSSRVARQKGRGNKAGSVVTSVPASEDGPALGGVLPRPSAEPPLSAPALLSVPMGPGYQSGEGKERSVLARRDPVTRHSPGSPSTWSRERSRSPPIRCWSAVARQPSTSGSTPKDIRQPTVPIGDPLSRIQRVLADCAYDDDTEAPEEGGVGPPPGQC